MNPAQAFIDAAELSDVEKTAEGLESIVYKGSSSTYGTVALKVPRVKVYHNVNDPHIEARHILQQEMRIMTLLHGGPVPVPRPLRLFEIDDFPALLSQYVDGDGSKAPPEELGRVAALIHSTPLPQEWDTQLIAHEGGNVLETLVKRMLRRFNVLVREVPGANEWAPNQSRLLPIAEQLKRFPSSLLHMDFRDVNMQTKEGQIKAVFDWSNALIGPAAIDLYRTIELGGHGQDFVDAYKRITPFPSLSRDEETFLRLDAALMLALVFLWEAPDPEQGARLVQRVENLARALRE